jgi:hypothetical protein
MRLTPAMTTGRVAASAATTSAVAGRRTAPATTVRAASAATLIRTLWSAVMLCGWRVVVLLRLATFTTAAAIAAGVAETLPGPRRPASILPRRRILAAVRWSISERVGRRRPSLAKAVPAAPLLRPACEALPRGVAGSAETLPTAAGTGRCMKCLCRGKPSLPGPLSTKALPVCHKVAIRRNRHARIRDRRPIRKSVAGLRRRHRNLSVKKICTRQLSAGGNIETLVRAAEAIAKRRHGSATHIRVAIRPS